MIAKIQPRHTTRNAYVKQLEARCQRLTELLDELWNMAVETLGDDYLDAEVKVVPEGLPSVLHTIAEKSAAALADVA